MQTIAEKSKGQASLTARKMGLANWRAYHIMQSAGNLRHKRKGRVEGEDERGGGPEDGLAQNEKLLSANQEERSHERKGTPIVSGALHDWRGGELLPLILCSMSWVYDGQTQLNRLFLSLKIEAVCTWDKSPAPASPCDR